MATHIKSQMKWQRHFLLWILLVGGLFGCATSPAPVEESAPAEASQEIYTKPSSQPEPQQPAVPKTKAEAPAAAKRLLRSAEAAYSAGKWSIVVQLAERALRIAPAQPKAYLLLARTYLVLGEGSRAQQMARKGLSWRPEGRLREQLEMISSP
ncbi:MAG: hypothetical protein K6L73_11705 [Cellvibrionaceae bacterium]